MKIEIDRTEVELIINSISHTESNPLLKLILHKVEHIMATHAEMAAELTAIKDQVIKSRTEVLAKIADLEAAQANAGNTTPEEDAAMAALKQEVQASDDIVADVSPTP